MSTWWRAHDLRVRLTVWHVAVVVVVLAAYVLVVYAVVSRSASESLDQRLRADFYWAAATLDDGPLGLVLSEPQLDLLVDEEAPWVQVRSVDGRQLLLTNAEARLRPIPGVEALASGGEGRLSSLSTPNGPVRVLSGRGTIGDRLLAIQVARSEAPMQQELRDLLVIFAFGLPLAVVMAGVGGYALASRALAPVERITTLARSITADRLGQRLPIDNPDDEMGRLAIVMNGTFARLQASFAQMGRFTADVSHELRTPLTALRSVGEVGLRGRRDEPAYRGIIGSMLEEADRLAGLVDRLLTLSRAETHQAPLSLEAVDLRDLAENVATHLGVLAEEKSQGLEVESTGAPVALADRVVLRQALINLVDNAIKFTPDGGRVAVRVFETSTEAIVEVADRGPGIRPDVRERIFDRFYRDERASGAGTGLGLSIAQRAIEANGGHLTLAATGPEGSTFRIAMPPATARNVRGVV